MNDIAPEWAADPDTLPDWLRQALAVPREEGMVQAAGAEIHYFRWGDRSKPGLLMAHGFLSHARCFAFIAPFLAQDYHIVAYDLSGMGDSGSRPSYPQDVRVAEMVEVAHHTGLMDADRKPVLIAHSYACGIGLDTMYRHHDRFAGFIICDMMAMSPERLARHYSSGAGPPSRRDPNRPHRIYPDFPSARERFVLSPPQPVGEAILAEYMAYHSLRTVDGGYSWKFDPRVLADDRDRETYWRTLGERIVGIPGRSAIIHGRESRLFDGESADWLRGIGARIPITGIPHAHHHLMLDQPIAFAAALETVLAGWRHDRV
ncbi:alpha/beta fold hydrolase [Pacificimonas pallii]|nr:alpha/beta hydrolase [Pacificimonas pallii]